jgi:hypothetical protein
VVGGEEIEVLCVDGGIVKWIVGLGGIAGVTGG